jgi:hypothetical protein
VLALQEALVDVWVAISLQLIMFVDRSALLVKVFGVHGRILDSQAFSPLVLPGLILTLLPYTGYPPILSRVSQQISFWTPIET